MELCSLRTLPAVTLSSVALAAVLAGCGGDRSSPVAVDEMPIVGEERAVMTAPPLVPPPIDRDHATKLIVDLEVSEETSEIADGVEYTFWTFGGTVPGSFIRVREGDLIEFNLSNHPESRMPHNIDLHAVTGPGGGATSSFTAPGHTSQFSFRARNPGLYVYHCATAPVGMHIANGMYGLILVEPRDGLPPVDREYYVMQGDFYTRGDFGDSGQQPFDMEKAMAEHADYVLFNGRVDALTGDNALRAEVGETVRLYLGNGGPNLVSSFHVIGEIFDRVHVEAGDMVNENVQTTLIPAGGAAVAEFRVEVPGTYILVDHSIFRAFNKGALGMLKVDGAEDTLTYSGRQDERIYQPEGGAVQQVPGDAAEPVGDMTIEQQMARGQRVYGQICAACHQPDGQGIPNAFPPLAESDYLMADVDRSIDVIIDGLSGPIEVNGETYNSVMPAVALSDQDVATVLTYVRNSFGNEGEPVSPEQVAARR